MTDHIEGIPDGEEWEDVDDTADPDPDLAPESDLAESNQASLDEDVDMRLPEGADPADYPDPNGETDG